MFHLLNFIAGMNTTLECRCSKELTHEMVLRSQEEEAESSSNECFEHMNTHCAQCCNPSDYSVKALRKLFLQKNLNSCDESKPKHTGTIIESLPVCKHCKQFEGMTEKDISERQKNEGLSVQELKKMYEAKVKSLDHASSVRSASVCSRPVTAKTEDRQDAISGDVPHPEGQMFMFHDEPNHSKPCGRWHITSQNITEISNGMQITFTLMADH
ncbi:uncharacterized protein LOC128721674 [Anopheles nili]|uniref:uncharacterized protein LOC128721674 n=1 Tax=Anopheles nili TaxID=185578 RepID=UPI00237C087D|nr:uncharacterized protein LOC128721674 [Anopheles nili]